jgi:hypothetical protein
VAYWRQFSFFAQKGGYIMSKRLEIGFGVIAWIASAVGFYLQLRTSNLPEILQGGIIVAWIAAGLIVISFVLGRELGAKNSGHSRDILNLAGVVSLYRRRDVEGLKPLSERIKSSNSDIFFSGLSLPKLDNYTGMLEEKARSGVHVRLLVPDPCEKWLIIALAKFLMREGPYPRELSWFFNNFLPVWKRSPEFFEVRVHKQLPTVTGAMFDYKEGNIEIYMHGWKTDERIILELDYDGNAKDCRANLERLWTEATPISSEATFQERITAADIIVQELKDRTTN